MVQPIQYQVPVADPFAGLLQGLKLGATVQDLQQAQAANELRRQQALQIQQKMEQQRQAQAELQRIEAIPEAMRSAQDTQAYFRLVDPKAAENLLKYSESRTKEQRANEARRLSQIWSALAADRGDIAQGLIQQMAEAEQDPNLKNMYGAYAEAAVKAPKALMSTIGGLASGLGKEYAESFEIARKAATPQGKIFASVEDKIRAGIVDEKGNALPGTYTRSESGTLQRISEKAPDQFGTYTQEQVAQRLGVPVDQVDPGLYSYNKTTQRYDRIGGAGTKVQIDMGRRAEEEARSKDVVDEYRQLRNSAAASQKLLASVDVMEGLINSGFKTGWATEAKAAAASFLSALGVPEATKFATSAQTFLAQSREQLLQKLILQKGPQTEGDSQRATQTLATLGNTTEANKFILAFTKAVERRGIDKAKFYGEFERKNKTLKGADIAWEDGPGSKSIFDSPSMTPYRNIVQGRSAQGQVPPAAPPSQPTAQATGVSSPTVTTRPLPPQAAIDYLRRNPSLAGAFDEMYGQGLASRILGGQ